MLELDVAALQHWLHQFMWPLLRIGGFFMVVPIIGTAVVPARIRLILTLLLTLLLAPTLRDLPHPDFLSPQSVVLAMQQTLIGIAMALFLQLLTQAFVTFGQIVAMQMGLGFASMNDPVNGIAVTSVSQFYLLMSSLLFLAFNGHLVMIDVLAESFRALPVGADIGAGRLHMVVGWGSWMFAAGLLMALPIVTALLIVNLSLGIITRAAPQLNIFAIGFPLMLVLGIVFLWASMSSMLPHFERLSGEALQAMRDWTQ